ALSKLALAPGAVLSDGLEEFYGRNMADVEFGDDEFVSLAQVFGRYSRIFNDERDGVFPPKHGSWAELALVQATAHQPGAGAWYLFDEEALDERVRYGTVRDLVAQVPTRTN